MEHIERTREDAVLKRHTERTWVDTAFDAGLSDEWLEAYVESEKKKQEALLADVSWLTQEIADARTARGQSNRRQVEAAESKMSEKVPCMDCWVSNKTLDNKFEASLESAALDGGTGTGMVSGDGNAKQRVQYVMPSDQILSMESNRTPLSRPGWERQLPHAVPRAEHPNVDRDAEIAAQLQAQFDAEEDEFWAGMRGLTNPRPARKQLLREIRPKLPVAKHAQQQSCGLGFPGLSDEAMMRTFEQRPRGMDTIVPAAMAQNQPRALSRQPCQQREASREPHRNVQKAAASVLSSDKELARQLQAQYDAEYIKETRRRRPWAKVTENTATAADIRRIEAPWSVEAEAAEHAAALQQFTTDGTDEGMTRLREARDGYSAARMQIADDLCGSDPVSDPWTGVDSEFDPELYVEDDPELDAEDDPDLDAEHDIDLDVDHNSVPKPPCQSPPRPIREASRGPGEDQQQMVQSQDNKRRCDADLLNCPTKKAKAELSGGESITEQETASKDAGRSSKVDSGAAREEAFGPRG